MLNKLFEIEKDIKELIFERIPVMEFKSMYIDYHPPIVERLWFDYGELRIYLHRIHKIVVEHDFGIPRFGIDALFHPHPWKSAIRIIKGSYEMGVGHSATDDIPLVDCKLILPQGTCYEMTEEDAWHYVNPTTDFVYSLMISGERSKRKMPVVPEPDKKFRSLTGDEQKQILDTFKEYYLETTWGSREFTFFKGVFGK